MPTICGPRLSGKDRWRGAVETLEHEIRQAPDARLWQFRNAARAALVDHVRERRARELEFTGAPADAIAGARELFDPRVLTIGFARRFATYKRPNLLLHDAARLSAYSATPSDRFNWYWPARRTPRTGRARR